MSGLFIGVKRLVAVDSSDFAYVELEIDKHSMLVAEGNAGKSSLINAIRLFFLPECSMAKQAINFGFSDSQGEFYTSEASFNHYFPSKYSFLILEYEKRLFNGEHCCQILTMGSGRLRFERMFTSLPYEKLRHLFWQDKEDEFGIGGRVDKLNKQLVYDFINKNDKHAQLAKEASKVGSLIYQSELTESEFTLFPLNKIDEQTINSLRALIKLLFVASNRNKKPFTDAIANIIEGSKKSSQDQLGFSISEFKASHELLKSEETRINSILNKQSHFNALLRKRASFIEYLDVLSQAKPAANWLNEKLIAIKQDVQKSANKRSILEQKLSTERAKLKNIEEDERLLRHDLKNLNSELTELEKKQKRLDELSAEFPSQSYDFIKDALNEELDEKTNELDVLNGTIERDEAIAKLEIKLKHKASLVEKLKQAIANQQFNLENQVPKNILNILHSINPTLTAANTQTAMSDTDIQVIEAFTQLFDEQAREIVFYDQTFPFNQYRPENKQAQLEKAEQELQAVQKHIAGLNTEQTSPLHVNQSKAQLEKAIKLATQDIELINKANYTIERINEIRTDIDDKEIRLSASEKLTQAQLKSVTDIQNQFEKAKREYEEFEFELRLLLDTQKKLTSIIDKNKQWIELSDIEHEFNGYLNEEQLVFLDTCANELLPLQYDIRNGLRDFIELNIIEDKHGVKTDAPNWAEISACLNDLEEVYGNLDTQRHLLEKQIQEHNQTIGNKRENIVQNYVVIKSFEKSINKAFENITINNVESIEFTIGVNRQFESLVQEFEHTNLFSTEMQSDAFYERLMAFAERFFDENDNFVLTLNKVIESFEPKVQLINRVGKEDKKQSNSTNSLIKLKLVQLLLKRLIAQQPQTAFPIVHDEIANIDIGQFSWWLNDLSEAGFCLLAAGTHSTSAELQAKIGRLHVLDAMTTAYPYHKERNKVYWNGCEEFEFNQDKFEQERLL